MYGYVSCLLVRFKLVPFVFASSSSISSFDKTAGCGFSSDNCKEVFHLLEREPRKGLKYLTLSFSSYEAFISFMDIMSASPDERFIKGENVLKLIE